MRDYYEILGVSRNASQEEIKKAYRRLAHQHHPDKGGDEKKFKEINEAYQALGDPQKRAQYDQFGSSFSQGFGGQGFEGFRGFPGFDFGDFMRGFSGRERPSGFDFGDIFEEFFGEAGRPGKKPKRRGQDIGIDIEITLEEAFSGLEREIELQKMTTCARCGGSGGEPGTKQVECHACKGTGELYEMQRTFLGSFTRVSICPQCQGDGKKPEKDCADCRGQGRVRKIERITVRIPAGINDKETIKIEGKGEAGGTGARPGDLYVHIHVKKHKFFERKGQDIHYAARISFTQAALGDTIDVPIMEGSISLKIPVGSESGDTIKLEGYGMPNIYGVGRGDQYVELKVLTPKKLTKKQKELLEQLKEEGI